MAISRTTSLPSDYQSMSATELQALQRKLQRTGGLEAFGQPTVMANTLSQAIKAARTREQGAASSTGSAPSGDSSSLYEEAKSMLGDVTGLYEAGGAYHQAFEASKRKAMQGAQASMVGMGMSNVYNPQASGAAYEAEARPAWELGRTQGLAGAMTNVAGLQAGRASELYQGGIQREGIQAGLTSTEMQTGASLAATGMQTAAQQSIASMQAQNQMQMLQMQLGAQQQASGLPVSPFASSAGMWG
jgi:hypothetical protein